MIAGMDTRTVFQRVIDACGSQAELTRRLNAGVPPEDQITTQAVNRWQANGIPPERARAVEAACNGAVTRYEICPEIFGPDPTPTAEAA